MGNRADSGDDYRINDDEKKDAGAESNEALIENYRSLLLLLTKGVPTIQHEDKKVLPLHLAVLVAGVGGMLPAISRIGASFAADPNQSPPALGFYFGLACFFLLGAVVVLTLEERSVRNAIFAGISAPAIVSSISFGLDEHGHLSTASSGTILMSPSTAVEGTVSANMINRYAVSCPLGCSDQSNIVSLRGAQAPLLLANNESEGRSFFRREDVLPPERVLIVDFPEDVLRLQNERIFVTFKDQLGRVIQEIVADTGDLDDFKLNIPGDTTHLVLSVLRNAILIPLPEEQFAEVVYKYEANVDTSNDFWWAIGLSRQRYSISSVGISLISLVPAVSTGIGLIVPERYTYGIDASVWQGEIDWERLVSGNIRFAIMRGTYGTRLDQNIELYWESFMSSGHDGEIAIGFYHFFRFGQDVREQADAFLELVEDKEPEIPFPLFISLYENDNDDLVDQSNYEEYLSEVDELISILEAETDRPILVHIGQQFLQHLISLAGRADIEQMFRDRIGVIQALSSETVEDYSWIDTFFIWQFAIGSVPGIGEVAPLNVLLLNDGDWREFTARERAI